MLWLFPSQVLTIFNASPAMLSFGVPALRIMCISYVFASIATMVASLMQSTKRVGFSLLINVLRVCLYSRRGDYRGYKLDTLQKIPGEVLIQQ